MKTYAEWFYKSNAWKECRNAYAKSKGNICERCYAKGLYNPGVIVHHRVHLNEHNINNPNISLGWDNLELLCRDCHAKEHHPTERRYTIEPDGRVLPK